MCYYKPKASDKVSLLAHSNNLGGIQMTNVNDIVERIAYYEKRHKWCIEADCRNLEKKYSENDDTAQGFLVAIRKQEHWNGDFDEIAKQLLKINPSKICTYIILRSVDCSVEMQQNEFKPEQYSKNELQNIAIAANSSIILRKIFEHVKEKLGRVTGYLILHSMSHNAVADTKLLDDLYRYDHRVSSGIFMNFTSNVSTDLLMEMFWECEVINRNFEINRLLQFNREEIYQRLLNNIEITPVILAEMLKYFYYSKIDINEKLVKKAEDMMKSLKNFSEIPTYSIKSIIKGTHDIALIEMLSKYLKEDE